MNRLPAMGMTPIRHDLLSDGFVDLAATLGIGASFLAAGFAASAARCVVSSGAGCACANEEMGKQNRKIAAAINRIIVTRRMWEEMVNRFLDSWAASGQALPPPAREAFREA